MQGNVLDFDLAANRGSDSKDRPTIYRSIDNFEILSNRWMEMDFGFRSIISKFWAIDGWKCFRSRIYFYYSHLFLNFFGRVKERVDFRNTIFIVYLSKLLDCWVFVYYLFFERMKKIGAFWNFGDIYIALYLGIWIFLDLFFSLLRFFQRMKGIGTNTLDLYATFIVRLSKMEGLNTLNFLSVFCERTFQLRITLTILIILSCVYRKIKRNEIRYKRGSSTCRGWK